MVVVVVFEQTLRVFEDTKVNLYLVFSKPQERMFVQIFFIFSTIHRKKEVLKNYNGITLYFHILHLRNIKVVN